MFRGSVKSTGYPLHSPVSPSLPLPCAITFQVESTLNFADKEVTAVAESGAKVYWMSEELYEDVTAADLPALALTI